MELFRNKEVKKMFSISLYTSLIAGALGMFVNLYCGIYVLIVCTILNTIFYLYTKIRYDQIAELSNQLDKVLHGNYSLDIKGNSEGELSILSSEIYKMTIKLREQAENLKADKIYLNNSLADISHQLRTPLTSINLLVSRLKNNNLDSKERMRSFRELNTLLDSIDWLISSLLKISKLESGMVQFKSDKIYVVDLINKALESLTIPMELREQTLDLNIDDNATYMGDFLWTVEALVNILKNCMDHTPSGGTLSIVAIENTIFTEIIICDTGKGIDEKDLPHIFERFYKGKISGDNNIGIGLALSRMIITRQNGVIYAKNNTDGGAQFILKFYKGAI